VRDSVRATLASWPGPGDPNSTLADLRVVDVPIQVDQRMDFDMVINGDKAIPFRLGPGDDPLNATLGLCRHHGLGWDGCAQLLQGVQSLHDKTFCGGARQEAAGPSSRTEEDAWYDSVLRPMLHELNCSGTGANYFLDLGSNIGDSLRGLIEEGEGGGKAC
jgi:hypothetical protein